MATPVLGIFGLILVAGLIGLVVLIGVAMNHPPFRAIAGAILGLTLLLGLPLLLAAVGYVVFQRRAVHEKHVRMKADAVAAVAQQRARMAKEIEISEVPAAGTNSRGREPANDAPTDASNDTNEDAASVRGLPPTARTEAEDSVADWRHRPEVNWTDDGTYFTRIDLGPVLREDYPELPEGPLPAVLEREQFRRLLHAHPAQRAAFEEKVSLALREFARRASSHRVKHVPFSLSEAIDKLVSEVMVSEVRLTNTIPLEGDAAEPSPTVAVQVLLEISQPIRQELLARAEGSVSRERIAALMVLGVLLLSLMGIALAFLKIDIRTQGRYRGRLALATAIGILVLLFGGVLLVMA